MAFSSVTQPEREEVRACIGVLQEEEEEEEEEEQEEEEELVG